MIFVFADRELDDRTRELCGPGGPVPVEPRIFDTLLYLIRARDRVVSKDELVREVWGAEHVSDSAVTRAIMEARRAVGDNASRGRVIKTFYGRGYRFVAPVTEEDGGRAAGAPRRLPARWPLWLAAGALAAGLAAGALVRPWEGGDGAPESRRPLALTLESRAAGEAGGEREALQLLALSLEDLLRLSLTRTPGILLLPGPGGGPSGVGEGPGAAGGEPDAPSGGPGAAAVDPALDGAGGAAAGAVLSLTVTPSATPGHARLEATLSRPRPGAPPRVTPLGVHYLPHLGVATDLSRFRAVRDAVVAQLAENLGTTVEAETAGGPQQAEAWLLYLQALTAWDVVCDGGTSVELLTRSLELDPGFAPAWYMLAGARTTLANLCAAQDGSLSRAQEAVERAIALAPEWPDPYQLKALVLLYRGEVEAAFTLLQTARKRFPDSLYVRLRWAEVLRYAGFLEEARRTFDEALAAQPEASYLADVVPYPYLYAGDWETFLRLLSGRTSPYYRYYRGYAQLMRGERAAAQATLAPAFAEHPGDLFGRLSQALLAIVRGEDEEARVVLAQLTRQRAGQEAVDGEVSFKIAQLLTMAGEERAGLEQLALAVEQGFFCPACLSDDPVLGRLEGDPGFRSILARATRRHRAFADRHGLKAETGGASGPSARINARRSRTAAGTRRSPRPPASPPG